jgi:hypothetical protein
MKILMKMMLLSTIAAVPLVSMAFAESSNKIMVQAEPGSNPSRMTYDKKVDIAINGNSIGEILEINQNSTPQAREVKLPTWNVGDSAKVNATFSSMDGTNGVSCSQSWPVKSTNSIGCTRIEIAYLASNDTCNLTCN